MFGGWGSTDILIVVWIWWSLALHCMLNFIYVMFWIHDVQTWLINNIIVFIYRYNCVYIYIYNNNIYKKKKKHIYIYIYHKSPSWVPGVHFQIPKGAPAALKNVGCLRWVRWLSQVWRGRLRVSAVFVVVNHGIAMPYCQWVIDSIHLPRLCNRHSPSNAAWAFEVLLKFDMGRYMGIGWVLVSTCYT